MADNLISKAWGEGDLLVACLWALFSKKCCKFFPVFFLLFFTRQMFFMLLSVSMSLALRGYLCQEQSGASDAVPGHPTGTPSH